MSSKKVSEKKELVRSENKVVEIVSAEKVNIGLKNYIYAFLILVGGIVLTFFGFKWYNTKKAEKFMVSYLIATNTVESTIDDISSLSLIKQEAPSAYFIYLGYTNDEDIYNFEKDLKKLIDKYKLNDMFYYVDLTNYIEKNESYLELIKKELNIEEINILPALIYIEDGKVKEVLDGINDTKLKIADVEKLLDVYEFEAVK